MNRELIVTWEVMKNNVDELVGQLEYHQNIYSAMTDEQRREFYYSIRVRFNEFTGKELSNKEKVAQAAHFVFLNKICFNGLYRVNKSGLFNVLIRDYKSPRVLDEENLFNASALL